MGTNVCCTVDYEVNKDFQVIDGIGRIFVW